MTLMYYLIAFGAILVTISFVEFFYFYHQEITYHHKHPETSKKSWITILLLFLVTLLELMLVAFLLVFYSF
ncbi:hypothetical protein CKN82_05710 [Carnobacterium divergens]|uniref:hypothetical protein n=1 Tax=Carnobacterium divergens TaxID=2748 RepID=UPI00107273C0|nr:hypothetical protein [Carnobacterium divergens]MDT1996691.1 hypothetical protein [Carnobacterium divergens]TFI65936.1 hypothetical protein CKN76_06150 [Carnobacterium divergens]TFI65986.1 hypothetical protein CKN59_06135 [Carnobacterium divergens]TFI69528.1 hypothetical protein CKN70_05760 [Carnobacterium divergens]TFI80819.1 hypothetical protein CKN74_06115 [Carnobacterium divergens]